MFWPCKILSHTTYGNFWHWANNMHQFKKKCISMYWWFLFLLGSVPLSVEKLLNNTYFWNMHFQKAENLFSWQVNLLEIHDFHIKATISKSKNAQTDWVIYNKIIQLILRFLYTDKFYIFFTLFIFIRNLLWIYASRLIYYFIICVTECIWFFEFLNVFIAEEQKIR